ncbi:MAG: recombinase family protein [Alphaproteobacteria bacterium]|nr:recombinase family protein [Alphaproteobacteria bacterium]
MIALRGTGRPPVPGINKPSTRLPPAGKLLFQVTSAFAEFERSIIRQRVNAGSRRRRRDGEKAERRPEAVRR